MKTLKVGGKSGECKVIIGETIRSLSKYRSTEGTFIVTDKNVMRHHAEKLHGFECIEVPSGEKGKRLQTIEEICSSMLEKQAGRGSFIIGFGGGAICDLAGFASSVYMRGIGLGLAPTTLLAQADAAIGGKNGVNLNGYKNIVGTFRQPSFCICDVELLGTLPKEEVRHGFAEVIKHAAIADEKLFLFLEENSGKALSLEKKAMEKIVHDSIAVKAGIVAQDEFEKGKRAKLNFGHTVGHALEKTLGLPHGGAVSIGMVLESRIAASMGALLESEAGRLEGLLKKFGLPVKASYDAEELVLAMKADKKIAGEIIRFPVLEEIGKARVKEMKFTELGGLLHDMR